MNCMNVIIKAYSSFPWGFRYMYDNEVLLKKIQRFIKYTTLVMLTSSKSSSSSVTTSNDD